MTPFRCAIAIGLLALSTLPATAADVWHSGTITHVYPLAEGSVVVSMSSDSASCTSASAPDYYYIQVGQNGVTAEGLRNMLATVLAAFAMGKTVSINFSDATAQCYINRLVINN